MFLLGQKVEKNISDPKFIGDFLAMSVFLIKFPANFIDHLRLPVTNQQSTYLEIFLRLI